MSRATTDAATVARVFRAEAGRCTATLVRLLGDLDAAEDAVQDAFATALDRWPRDGVPDRPGAWITTVARNHAVDRLRRARRGGELERTAAAGAGTSHAGDPQELEEVGPVADDQLRLLFTCCHPSLSEQARVALTLRLLGGLSTQEVARAFLVTEEAMSRRLVRAKARIRELGIEYRVPAPTDLPERLDAVLAVVYLVHTTGADRPAGDAHGDALCDEALRLARLLVALLPDEPEPLGLLGLLLLSGARRPARHDATGRLVLLADQDRSRWDAAMVAEGLATVRACLERDHPGPYQVQAAIQAVHTEPAAADEVDWSQVLALYDHLQLLRPGPVVALNRAVALAEVRGVATALDVVEELAGELGAYAPFHAVHGELLLRAGRTDAARAAFDRGAAAAQDPAVADHLRRRAGP